jgi:hypothetical protein
MSNFPEMEYKSMEQVIELPENGTSLNLLQQVYRNPSLPVLTRTRAAIAALPFEHPRLAVVATVNAGDFADQLEKAVERSRKIEAKPMTNVSSANVPSDTPSGTKTFSNGKPMIIDRRYRRW